MYGHHQSLLYRDEDDLMFPMEATEEEEVSRRSTDWVCCEEADDGPGELKYLQGCTFGVEEAWGQNFEIRGWGGWCWVCGARL